MIYPIESQRHQVCRQGSRTPPLSITTKWALHHLQVILQILRRRRHPSFVTTLGIPLQYTNNRQDPNRFGTLTAPVITTGTPSQSPPLLPADILKHSENWLSTPWSRTSMRLTLTHLPPVVTI